MFLRGDDEDYTMTTRARLLERIRVTLAGRAAEELVLGDATTYSVKDLRVRWLRAVEAREGVRGRAGIRVRVRVAASISRPDVPCAVHTRRDPAR